MEARVLQGLTEDGAQVQCGPPQSRVLTHRHTQPRMRSSMIVGTESHPKASLVL